MVAQIIYLFFPRPGFELATSSIAIRHLTTRPPVPVNTKHCKETVECCLSDRWKRVGVRGGEEGTQTALHVQLLPRLSSPQRHAVRDPRHAALHSTLSRRLALQFAIIIIIIITRNKSNASFEAVQYRQDVFPIAHYHNRKNFPTYRRCSENYNNTCAENRKIRGLKFDTP